VQPRQLDICESYGLLIMLFDKGRICVFKMSEFNQIVSDGNWDPSQTKTKANCKEHKLDFISGCHKYAISKQLINKSECLKIIAACGKKLILAQMKSPDSSNGTICNTCATTLTFSSLVINPVIGLSNLALSSTNNQNAISSESPTDLASLFIVKKVNIELFLSDIIHQFYNIDTLKSY
jgi:hypothetical protein